VHRHRSGDAAANDAAVGGYRKSQIRALAGEIGRRVADKKDSQEICFVSDDDYAGFVERRWRSSTTANSTCRATLLRRRRRGWPALGRSALHHWPAQGIGLAFGEPRYVVKIDADAPRV